MSSLLDRYILGPDGRTPRIASPREWARWMETAGESRRVAETVIGRAVVSTVFLGIDHQYEEGPLLLFETLVMGDAGEHTDYLEHCSTWAEAEEQHARVVAMVRED